MKKLLAILLTLALSLSFTAALADTVTIGVPNDTTNEARALLLHHQAGHGQRHPGHRTRYRGKPLQC